MAIKSNLIDQTLSLPATVYIFDQSNFQTYKKLNISLNLFVYFNLVDQTLVF